MIICMEEAIFHALSTFPRQKLVTRAAHMAAARYFLGASRISRFDSSPSGGEASTLPTVIKLKPAGLLSEFGLEGGVQGIWIISVQFQVSRG